MQIYYHVRVELHIYRPSHNVFDIYISHLRKYLYIQTNIQNLILIPFFVLFICVMLT